MKTLIVPCAGRTLIGKTPKYLIRHPEGELLIEKCMSGISVDSFDRIIITILKKDIELYNSKTVLEDIFKNKAEIIVLEHETKGPAETVYKTIKLAKVYGSIVIKDSDNYLKTEDIKYGNFVAGLDLNEWDRDIHNLRNKSFLILNEQKQILDVFEKQFKSDVICLGMYGFSNAEDFVFAYEKLNDSSYPIDKLYVSHIISYLIGYSQRVFHYISTEEYENWGNGKVWNDVQKSYATYFIDIDRLIEETGLVENQMKNFAKLQKRGARFVGFTSGDKNTKEKYLNLFNHAGIHCLDVVCGCSYSSVKTIISSEQDIKDIIYEL